MRRIGHHIGITANPLLGMLGDCMVDAGATWILSETEEVVGAEHSLIERRQALMWRPA